MIIDSDLLFTGTANGATGGITGGPYVDKPTTGTQAASNVIDLGLNGIPLPAGGGGARDIGVGDDPMLKLMAVCTVPLAGGTTIQLQLQGAPDDGTGNPGAYTTMWTGPAVATAQAVAGAQLANVDVPRTIPGQPLPRFLKMNFIGTGTFTWTGPQAGGGIEAAIVIDRFDQPQPSGALSGYPAGVVVAN